MRAFQIFASMSPEQSTNLLGKISEKSPMTFQQGLATACGALKIRPVYLKKQPFEKKASSLRRALSLVASSTMAEEMLAIYFLECRKELLVEWLDALGLDHEDGSLGNDDPEAPDAAALSDIFHAFLAKEDDSDRPLLVRAFACQAAIEWPELDALIESELSE